MRQLLIRTPAGGLFPADQEAREWMSHLPVGKEIFCQCVRPRNPKFHRKAFALLNLVLQSQERYTTIEHLLTWLKLEVGHYEEFVRETGELVLIPKSIAFASMSEDQFQEFYGRALEALRREFLSDMDDATLDVALQFYENERRTW